MNRLQGEEAVLVVATTNRIEALDEAFFRPGRFGVKIHIDYPNRDDRRAILRHHARRRNLPLDDRMIERIVDLTEGPVDPDLDRQAQQYLDAHLQHMGAAAFYAAAGPLAVERLREELRLPRSERFSGDHLRAICQNLLIEIRYREYHKKPIDLSELIDRAIESVRPRRATPVVVQPQPRSVPVPREVW
jgi:SpoVK/Ycf46/Vps4 family AAA+-type ATPase